MRNALPCHHVPDTKRYPVIESNSLSILKRIFVNWAESNKPDLKLRFGSRGSFTLSQVETPNLSGSVSMTLIGWSTKPTRLTELERLNLKLVDSGFLNMRAWWKSALSPSVPLEKKRGLGIAEEAKDPASRRCWFEERWEAVILIKLPSLKKVFIYWGKLRRRRHGGAGRCGLIVGGQWILGFNCDKYCWPINSF